MADLGQTHHMAQSLTLVKKLQSEPILFPSTKLNYKNFH